MTRPTRRLVRLGIIFSRAVAFRDEQVFRVVAPLEDDAAAIAMFNLPEGGRALSGASNAKDCGHAGELLLPKDESSRISDGPANGLFVYDRETKTVSELHDVFEAVIRVSMLEFIWFTPDQRLDGDRPSRQLPAGRGGEDLIRDRRPSRFYAQRDGSADGVQRNRCLDHERRYLRARRRKPLPRRATTVTVASLRLSASRSI